MKTSRLRILLVTTDFLPNVSGIATLSYEQATGLAGLGHDVLVLTATPGAAEFSKDDNFMVREKVVNLPPIIRLKSFISILSNTVDEWKPDFIWCPNYRGYGLPVMKIARSKEIPYGFYIHGTELLTETRNKLRHRVLQNAMRRAKALCTNSRNTAELLNRLYDTTAMPVTPGVHLPTQSPADIARAASIRRKWLEQSRLPLAEGEPLIFISVCRISRQKGINVILNSLTLLDDVIRKKVLYVAVGSGDALDEFRQLAESLGLQNHVLFEKSAGREEIQAVYRAADVYLQPSQPEGNFLESFGISFLEAQAAGLPCIGTDWGGIPEAVRSGITARLVPTGSADAVATAITDTVNAPDWRASAAKKGPEWASQNTWDAHVHKLDEIIQA